MIYSVDFTSNISKYTFIACIVLLAFFLVMGILYFFALIKTREQYSKEFSRKLSYIFFGLIPGMVLILISITSNIVWLTYVGFVLEMAVIFIAMRLLNKAN